MPASATTTKTDAYERLLRICEKQGGELDQFIADIQGTVADDDFNKVRRMVGEIMGKGHYTVIMAIVDEFPELRPSWLERTR